MSKLLKTLTLITTGLVVGVVVGRANRQGDIHKLDVRKLANHLAEDSLSNHSRQARSTL